MTRYQPQWLQSGSYAAGQDRRLLGALWPAPASTGCAVSAGAGMVVNVAPGQVAVPSQNNTGTTLCSSDAVEPVTVAAASGSNPRIDVVICQPRGNDLDGGANNDFIFTTVQGTPAASPAVPAVPAGAAALAQILVPTGSASVAAGNITDVRPQGLSISGGAAVPPYTGGGIGTYTDPGGEVWVAKTGVNGGAWRKARDVLHARWYRAAAWSTATGAGVPIVFDTVDFDAYGMWVSGSSGFVAPVAGVYRAGGAFTAPFAAAGQYVQLTLVQGAAQIAQNTLYGAGAVNGNAAVTDIVRAAAGDVLSVQARTTAVQAGLTGRGLTYFNVDYVGTG